MAQRWQAVQANAAAQRAGAGAMKGPGMAGTSRPLPSAGARAPSHPPPSGLLKPGGPVVKPGVGGASATGMMKKAVATDGPQPAFTVSTQSKKDEIGIQTLVGDYADNGTNHGRRYYQKMQKIQGHEDVKVFLYYWDERDGADFSGWWFGDALGGSQVWARAASNAATPPRVGWRIPWDSPKAEPGILMVDQYKSGPIRAPGGPAHVGVQTPAGAQKFDPARFQDKIMEARMKVEEFEATADDLLAVAKAATIEGAAPEALAEIKTSLEKQQTTLMELQKHLTAEVQEMRKVGGAQATSLVTEISKLSPRLMKLRPTILTELGKVSKVAGNAAAAAKNAATAAAQKAAEEKDAKELAETLPAAQELAAAAEDAVESLSILASPLVADPPDDGGELLKEAMTEIETATAEAQTKIAEARKEITNKLQAARKFAPETRKKALTEFSNIQTKLTEAQKKLNPYKNFKATFKERVEAKKALKDIVDNVDKVELEVEKASNMTSAASQGQMSEDEVDSAEKVVTPAHATLMSIVKVLETKMKATTDGPVKDELNKMKEKAMGIKKKLDASSATLKTQREGISVQQIVKSAVDKVQKAEEALEKTQEAEMPFLKGIEVLPPDESSKAIAESEAAYTKAEHAAQQAAGFIKQKLAASKSYSKETQKSFGEEMDTLQKRLDETRKKIDAFKKETMERKMAAFMSEVMESVTGAEEKVKAFTEAADIFTKDNELEAASPEALKEALEKSKAAEKEAQDACGEARKVIAAKQSSCKGKASDMVAAISKVQSRLNVAQQDLAKVRRASTTGERLIKAKEVINEQDTRIKGVEEEVEKLDAMSNPGEMGLGDEKLSDEQVNKIDTGVKEAQKTLKESQRLVEAQIPGAAAALKPALEGLRDRAKKAQEIITKILAATKDQRERVVSEGYVKEAVAQADEMEAGMEKVNDAELPFLKGLEVLPLKEAHDTIINSEKAAAAVQKIITDLRNFIAAKNLEVKKFVESASKPAAEEFTKVTERINDVAAKLSQFRKDTELRRKSAALQEAGEKVEHADGEVKKLAEVVEPYNKEEVDDLSGEAAAEVCEKLTAAAKAAQQSVDGARSFLAARNREVKDPTSKETLTKLLQQLSDVAKRCAESKKIAGTIEGKFVHKKLVFEANQVIAGVEEELKKATEACAPLLEHEGIDFLVANSAGLLATILREQASNHGLSGETLFQQVGGTSEDAFVAWLGGLPQKLEREEVNFSEERRKAIFKHLDATKGGSISLDNFKDMFKRRFTCKKQISVTDTLDVAQSKTTCKLEVGDVVEAVGIGATTTDEGGMARIECKVPSKDAGGFVTISGNEGTTYLEVITAFKVFEAEMDKTISETGKAINKGNGFFNTKAKELPSAGGPLAEARAELLKLRPKVTEGLKGYDALRKQVQVAKIKFAKREAEEKVAHITAKEQKQADAVLELAKAKVEATEATAKKLEEAAAPLVSVAAGELEAFATPAAVQAEATKFTTELAENVSAARACIKEEVEKLGKVSKGPLAEAQRELGKMRAKVDTSLKAGRATEEKVKKACETISSSKSALISTAMREEVLKKGTTVDALFDQLAGADQKISEEAFCKHAASLDGAIPQEHLALVARSVESGGITRRKFLGFVQRYYIVVKPIAITDVIEVTKAKTKRKAEINEIIEVLEGPCIDEKLKMKRIRGKSMTDSLEGWISIQGNQGTPFLTEAEKPYYCTTAEAPMEQEFSGKGEPVRTLKADEIVELLEGPKKEIFSPALRVRGKACSDQATGWFTAKDRKGTIMAEADAKYYSCVASVAMTDELDVKNCKVVRKLAVGELFTVTEGPVDEKESGITRIKGKAVKDDKEGWITSKGNAGTVYAEPSKKHYSIVQSQPMTKLMKSTGTVEEVRKLEAGEAVLLLEGPKEEAFPPETRIKGRALSDGAVGWITIKATGVKKWSPYYKVVKATPMHDAKAVEGAQVLREVAIGEVAEWLEGPVEEGKETRIKARLQKDGVVGWVSIKDGEGKKLLENSA